MTEPAQGFLNSLSPTTPLDVRTIVPTFTGGMTTDDPIVITGSSNGSQVEAFVIDMRSITGKTLQVDNIELVSVMGNATVTGGAGDNYAVGDDNAQFISLGVGNDTLFGGGGNDLLYGGQSDSRELLVGGSGDDTLWGGKGADLMSGGDGADLFVVEADGGADRVTDFAGASGDRIRIGANANGSAIDSFAELKAAATDSADGVTIALGGGNTLLLMGVRSSELQADWFSVA